MDTPKEYGQRIRTVASKRGLSPQSLKSNVSMNGSRFNSYLSGDAKPGSDHEVELAIALDVNAAVLQNDTAFRLWQGLFDRSLEGFFPGAFRKLVVMTGQRGSDSIEASDELIDEVILETQSDLLGKQIPLL